MAKKKKLEQEIPIVPVPEDMWEEMLARGGNDPQLAKWIWSCWQARPEIETVNPLDNPNWINNHDTTNRKKKRSTKN